MERRSLLQLTMLGISAGALGSTGESARQLLALALNDEPRDVDDWHLTLSDHLHALRTRSPAQVSKDMMVDLIAIKYQSRTAKAEDKTELQRVTAGLSILHANALTRLGDHGAAIQWERTARMTADASGDLNLRLMVRCEEAGYGLYGQRDLTTVLQLIEAAEHLAGDTPSFWHADLAGSRAKAMSLLGRHDEAKKALNTFVGYEGKDARAGIIPALWTMSQAHFAESWVYAHEGNESEAGRAREIVVARTRDYQYTANVQLHEALCTVVNGGADHGTTRATEILTALPPTQQSQMIIETGKAVLRAVPVEKRDRPAVRELHAALTSGQNRTALT
ncbi:hypothetical protein [Actinomadura roseirufa]|uniref:hypothetical protein n=1 Tax=Actinomadura roseirufa TaxID=2094049 RepID=UPI0010411C44|nr:hypothetical protein [Actinomadura roseirufa]